MARITLCSPAACISADLPTTWSFTRRAVPSLLVPREIFALSNRPITPVPADSEQPRPMIANLDTGALFMWCYSQRIGDPEPVNRDPLPDYQFTQFPLRYAATEVFPASDAREWDGSGFLWRRIGYYVGGDVAVTTWIWEGTRASREDLNVVEQILSSLQPQA